MLRAIFWVFPSEIAILKKRGGHHFIYIGTRLKNSSLNCLVPPGTNLFVLVRYPAMIGVTNVTPVL
jgi:hypothetical protein